MSRDIKSPFEDNYDPYEEHEYHFGGLLDTTNSTIVNKTEITTTIAEDQDSTQAFTSRKIVHTQTIITTSPYKGIKLKSDEIRARTE